VALAAAAQQDDYRLVDVARHDARKLWREGAAWAQALSRLLQAGAARRRGEDAAAVLRDAAARCDAVQMGLYAAAARWQLGWLESGGAGAALATEAAEWMRRQRVANPARMAALLVPGFA
jgi:hypothetical protein